MARQKVSTYPLEQRLQICDLLVDGHEPDAVRQALRDAGLMEADLPSDHSLKTYQEGSEYTRHYEDRVRAYRLEHWKLPEVDESTDWGRAMEAQLLAGMCLDLRLEDMEFTDKLQTLRALTQRRGLEYRERVAASRYGISFDKRSVAPTPRDFYPDGLTEDAQRLAYLEENVWFAESPEETIREIDAQELMTYASLEQCGRAVHEMADFVTVRQKHDLPTRLTPADFAEVLVEVEDESLWHRAHRIADKSRIMEDSGESARSADTLALTADSPRRPPSLPPQRNLPSAATRQAARLKRRKAKR